jgi:hypothetical protein
MALQILERWLRKKLRMQGVQKLRSAAHLRVHRNAAEVSQQKKGAEDETIIFLVRSYRPVSFCL